MYKVYARSRVCKVYAATYNVKILNSFNTQFTA